jgi:hypothetical protein
VNHLVTHLEVPTQVFYGKNRQFVCHDLILILVILF